MASTSAYAGTDGTVDVYGGVPESSDTIPSVVFSIVYFALGGLALFRYRNPAFRCLLLMLVALSSLIFGIAFAIRAGLANEGVTQSGLLGLQVCLTIGQILMMDIIITLTRDVISVASPISVHILFTFLSRIILVVALVLICIGSAWKISPANADQADQGNALHLAGAIIQFITMLLDVVIFIVSFIMHRMLHPRSYLLFGLTILTLGPAVYSFTIVALNDPSSILEKNDMAYFLVTFGVMQGLVVLICAVLNLNFWFFQMQRPYMALRTLPPVDHV